MYKRALENSYSLKLKHSRLFYHTITQKFPSMPFSIASLEDITTAKVGVAECVNHDLLHMYPVLTEKPGELVAHFKATIALLPSGGLVLTGLPFEETFYEPEFQITDPDLLALLATSLDRKQAKKDKKAKEAKAEHKDPVPVPTPTPTAVPTAPPTAPTPEVKTDPVPKEDKKA